MFGAVRADSFTLTTFVEHSDPVKAWIALSGGVGGVGQQQAEQQPQQQ